MKTEHTPGPWTVSDGFVRIEEQADILVADVGTKSEWVAVGYSDADGFAGVVALTHPINAHLIAAAPDLLQALQEIEASARAMDDDGLDRIGHIGATASKAIAKATSDAESREA